MDVDAPRAQPGFEASGGAIGLYLPARALGTEVAHETVIDADRLTRSDRIDVKGVAHRHSATRVAARLDRHVEVAPCHQTVCIEAQRRTQVLAQRCEHGMAPLVGQEVSAEPAVAAIEGACGEARRREPDTVLARGIA